jgi:hypothetical protein
MILRVRYSDPGKERIHQRLDLFCLGAGLPASGALA